ncbi:hypothetical protein EXIGLDRAFT_807612 [Exidia glandulosa HHB12029]|uniref:Uncharacterized protein n=1 Tax=Exidia glandulosa HHB12029 TaxID=1314781 RepID=A0A165D8J7_EXIGL|nr:hypothetical protein EXIGLDRAFT_807612 [Exidia glandulosa HHB12029]
MSDSGSQLPDPSPPNPPTPSPPPSDSEDERVPFGPHLPRAYIRYEFPVKSGRPVEYISLDGDAPDSTPDCPSPSVPPEPSCPWAPFACKADFEFAEAMVRAQMSRSDVDSILNLLHGSWCRGGSNVTFRTYKDMLSALDAARNYIPDFEWGSVSVRYSGNDYEHKFLYRDPWRWTVSLVGDPVLAKTHIWNAARKYYCEEGQEDRLIDETNTADTWWKIEETLPEGHFLLPLHVWLDKCRVTSKVKMHPMILRPLWQPSEIRNASGNGGGVLFGYMPIILDPLDPMNDFPKDEGDFALYKRRVYNAILGFIFDSCRLRSRVGDILTCGDGTERIVHPCVMIESLDGEEAAFFCSCYAASANHPCPQCLVHKSDLARLSLVSEPRTVLAMKIVVQQAKEQPVKTHRDALLRSHGIHPVEHFLWDFGHSDPYAAVGYDLLHRVDAGIFGHHLWPLVVEVVKDLQCENAVNLNFSHLPLWPELDHFNGTTRRVTLFDFSDGNTFMSILETLPQCIVQQLPRNSCLVRAVAWCQAYRIIAGLKCIAASQLAYLKDTVIKAYEKECTLVSNKYGKNFDFPKQHGCAHVVQDVYSKGSTINQSTRPGEGYIQEVKQQYWRTNGREAEKQMTDQDAYSEVVAQIRTSVDAANAAHAANDDRDEPPRATGPDPPRVSFGAASRKWEHLDDFEALLSSSDPLFLCLERKLRAFLAASFPKTATDDALSANIMVQVYSCLYANYDSLEDFRAARDILRCNRNWSGKDVARHDCVLLNSNGPPRVGRLRLLLRCKLMATRDVVDVVAITRFEPLSARAWRPQTAFRGCRLYKEHAELTFIDPDSIVRGGYTCPAFQGPESARYLLDSVGGGDMFLRLNDLAAPQHLHERPESV